MICYNLKKHSTLFTKTLVNCFKNTFNVTNVKSFLFRGVWMNEILADEFLMWKPKNWLAGSNQFALWIAFNSKTLLIFSIESVQTFLIIILNASIVFLGTVNTITCLKGISRSYFFTVIWSVKYDSFEDKISANTWILKWFLNFIWCEKRDDVFNTVLVRKWRKKIVFFEESFELWVEVNRRNLSWRITEKTFEKIPGKSKVTSSKRSIQRTIDQPSIDMATCISRKPWNSFFLKLPRFHFVFRFIYVEVTMPEERILFAVTERSFQSNPFPAHMLKEKALEIAFIVVNSIFLSKKEKRIKRRIFISYLWHQECLLCSEEIFIRHAISQCIIQ